MAAETQKLLGHLLRLTEQATPDATLLGRWVQAKDENAFSTLVARHGPMVFGVCGRVLGDRQLAEDAFQATFLVLARKAATLKRPDALPGYLYGVALRLARKARARRPWRSTAAQSGGPEPTDPRPHTLDAVSGRELLAMVDAEVARLPEAYRLPVLMCVLQERSVDEAARILDCSPGSVRGRLARGRQRLRQRLTQRGLVSSEGVLALLAPAKVPHQLLAASLRNLSGAAPAAVSALAAGAGLGLSTKALGVVCVLTAVGLGTGVRLLPKPASPEPTPIVSVAPAIKQQVLQAPATSVVGGPASVEEPKRPPNDNQVTEKLPPGAVARLGMPLFHVSAATRTLALSPDGKTAAVASEAGLFLVDAGTGKLIRQLPGPAKERTAERLAFAPDGTRLAGTMRTKIGKSDHAIVRVWDLTGKRRPVDFAVENAAWLGWSAAQEPLAVCWEPAGIRLVGLSSQQARRFACEDLPRPDQAEADPHICVTDNRLLAAADKNGIVHLWDLNDATEHRSIHPKGDRVLALALSPDARQLASVTRATVQVWEAATGKLLYGVDASGGYRACQFSADGKLLAVESARGGVWFWDAATGKERSFTGTPFLFAEDFALSADGKSLVRAELYSGAVHRFDVSSGVEKRKWTDARWKRTVFAFAPRGQHLATASGQTGTIQLWDLTTYLAVSEIRRPGETVSDLAYAADGRSLYSAWTDNSVWAHDMTTGKGRPLVQLEKPELEGKSPPVIHVRASSDGKRLVTVSQFYSHFFSPEETFVAGWDLSSQKRLFRRHFSHASVVTAISADGRLLALDAGPVPYGWHVATGPIRLEDLESGERWSIAASTKEDRWQLTFSPNGRLLAGGFSERGRYQICLWETATGSEVKRLGALERNNYVNQATTGRCIVAFSPDGRLLACLSPSQEMVIWDLALQREQRRFKGYDGRVIRLAFAADGRRLLAELEDATQFVWDSTLLVWDVGPLENLTAIKPADGIVRAWADLAGSDAERAFRARWALVSCPDKAVALLQKTLRPIHDADTQKLLGLVADLGSPKFAIRAKAQVDLEALAEHAEPALREVLANNPPLEVQRRVQRLLDCLRVLVAQRMRALAVLEDIGTPAARKLLQTLASGAPAPRLTREAQASLDRLAKAELPR